VKGREQRKEVGRFKGWKKRGFGESEMVLTRARTPVNWGKKNGKGERVGGRKRTGGGPKARVQKKTVKGGLLEGWPTKGG